MHSTHSTVFNQECVRSFSLHNVAEQQWDYAKSQTKSESWFFNNWGLTGAVSNDTLTVQLNITSTPFDRVVKVRDKKCQPLSMKFWIVINTSKLNYKAVFKVVGGFFVFCFFFRPRNLYSCGTQTIYFIILYQQEMIEYVKYKVLNIFAKIFFFFLLELSHQFIFQL